MTPLLEEEACMVDHDRECYMLRGDHSQLAPISRLPPEVLGMIFLLCVPDPRCGHPFPQSHAFSQVCQHWRGIALDTAVLWLTVPRATLELTDIFLSRSRNASLDVHVSDDFIEGPVAASHRAALALVLSHLNRVRSLDLVYDIETWLMPLSNASINLPAPLLVDLSIKAYSNQASLPDDFLGLYAPRLSHLYLGYVSFNWPTLFHESLVRALTILELDRLPADSFPSGGELAMALRSMPFLRNIVIRMVEAEHDQALDPMPISGDVPLLSHLTVLRMYGPGPQTCHLLQQFKVPSTTSLHLCLTHTQQQCNLGPLSALLKNHCTGGAPGPRVRRMHYLGSDERHVLRVYPSCEADLLLALVIEYSWPSVYEIVRTLELKELTHLELSTDEDMDPLALTRLFPLCQSATRVRLHDLETCETVVPFLIPSEARALLLPRMRWIYLDLTSKYGEDSDSFLLLCEDLLIERYEASDYMLKMVFVHPPPDRDSEDYERLRQISPTLIWSEPSSRLADAL
ncbi:hypothetical protein PUNSTDRAFT_47240 [Punctularia strigosozonata HHB-11173 SS5]|uniref:Uncharacterized protein n=1 Tax=Punctularia strigosozonata (strain HHB-11173) TaxID=741275 RepID=R7S3N3_PUNST|nr:uncharacterized protein PUNSTDRAFT_47240 [Punctularia strigosozonata HHB-11173 SS5]EIN05010.1 hypothetical protein PUNSTDRAFT_47240 [Punctularia strigosozonata HHB-11173 SS5]